MPWHDDMRAVSAAIARQQKRDQPLMVDPETNYLPGRNAPRPEWDRYWELVKAQTGARVNPDLPIGPLPMPTWHERPLVRRGLQMTPPLDTREPEQEAPSPPSTPGVIRPKPGQKRNPWD